MNTFFSKRLRLLVLVAGLFSSAIYAADASDLSCSGGTCTVGLNHEEPITYTVTTPNKKSSAIPVRREFPVNATINPCDNFYEYACSPVISSFELRADRSRHTFSFSDADERLLDFKKQYFKDLAQKQPESVMEEEVKNSYLACMNQEGRKQEELAYVAATKEKLGKITTREEFIDMIAGNITNSSELSFVGFAAGMPNLDRPEYNDLLFSVGLMSLPERSYYENEELVKELKEIIEQFFVTIGETAPKEKAELVFGFERELAGIYPTPPEIDDRVFSRTEISREKLIKDFPNLKLEKFLSAIPGQVVIRDIVGVDTMAFINRKLETALLEELKSVYLYFQLKSIMDDAYPEFYNKKFEFNKKYLGGPNQRSDRQERCTQLVMGSFEKEVDYILLPKLFPNFPKEKFIRSIEKIRVSLIEQLQNNNWLSVGTKEEAIRKMRKAKLALVSPNNEEEWDFNPRGSYTTDAPIANSHKLDQLLLEKGLRELQGPINTNRWGMGPLTVNAYYDPSYNKILFPVGILQHPFYDASEPEEVNLGAIGVIIGHELGHAIDNHGNGYNADGVLKPWMSDGDKKIFGDKTQYLINQFNKIGHNGEFTLGENIGDLVGLTTAYRTAFPADKEHDQELKRKFFLQYARAWCSIEREGFTARRLKTDPHSLEWARTNEQVKHQPGFQEAYNCKPGDPMVLPEGERIRVW